MSLNIPNARFCVNRKIAPRLSIPQFFKLVSQLGIHNVELRNDMPSGRVTDDLSGDEVKALAHESGIRIVTINALYPFNQLNEEVLQRARQLLSDAQAVGAESLVLCPLNDGTPISAADSESALKTLAPLFAEAGIQGLVEPLGSLTLRRGCGPDPGLRPLSRPHRPDGAVRRRTRRTSGCWPPSPLPSGRRRTAG